MCHATLTAQAYLYISPNTARPTRAKRSPSSHHAASSQFPAPRPSASSMDHTCTLSRHPGVNRSSPTGPQHHGAAARRSGDHHNLKLPQTPAQAVLVVSRPALPPRVRPGLKLHQATEHRKRSPQHTFTNKSYDCDPARCVHCCRNPGRPPPTITPPQANSPPGTNNRISAYHIANSHSSDPTGSCNGALN